MTKVERTRRLIIDIANDLIIRDGYQKVSISEVAGKADISRVTFYRYFRTVEDIIIYQVDEMFKEVEEQAQLSEISKADSRKEILEKIIEIFENHMTIINIINIHTMHHLLREGFEELYFKHLDEEILKNKKAHYIVAAQSLTILSIIVKYILLKDITKEELFQIMKIEREAFQDSLRKIKG